MAQHADLVARIALGLIFLWAFVDKTFGLGFATPAGRAWIRGGSPTTGFLRSVDGPFAFVFTPMAGVAAVDAAFMLGMLLVGVALVLGIALRLAAIGAVLLMVPLYFATLPHVNNPLVDEHIIYALTAVVLAVIGAGDQLGLGCWWRRVVGDRAALR